MLRKLLVVPPATSPRRVRTATLASAACARERASRGAPESAGVELGGALEIGEADAIETVVLATVEGEASEAGAARDDVVVDYRDALRLFGTGDLVLATAARYDLVGEASGGAERGTAVTAATPIDIASIDAAREPDPEVTFTLAAPSDAVAQAAATDGAGTGPSAS